MSMSIIKEIIPFDVNLFTYTCNLSFHSGDFPNAIKIAKVLPVHKNDSKNEFNNYRPVSLLPIMQQLHTHIVTTYNVAITDPYRYYFSSPKYLKSYLI